MKKYFVTGLLIWVPLGITLWVLRLLNDAMDGTLLLLPQAARPEAWLGRYVPGLGIVLTLLVVLVTGMLAANFLGRRIVGAWENLLSRIPVVKSIYGGVKQVSDTVFATDAKAFRKTLLVRFPHEHAWTLAFLTGEPGSDIQQHLDGDYVNVYVPTTPNPTGGYFLMLRRQDVIELDIKVDVALRYILSMGVVAPHHAATPNHKS